MADSDNVRVLYKNGLILGADELADDQSYFRAALERRSLSRDAWGIAWGLDLDVSAGGLKVKPGIAYGGDGKVIIVREKEDITHLFDNVSQAAATQEWIVSVVFQEREDQSGTKLKYCRESLDPRVSEGYRFDLESMPSTPRIMVRRDRARLEPEAMLAEASSAAKSRVVLGVVARTISGNVATYDVKEDARPRPCRVAEVEPAAEGAQYIGLVGATLTHPRRWARSLDPAQPFTIALEVEPESGLHAHDPLIVHADVLFEGQNPQSDETFRLGWKSGNTIDLSICTGQDQTLISAGRTDVRFKTPLVAEKDATFKAPVAAKQGIDVDGLADLETATVGTLTVSTQLNSNGAATIASATIGGTLTVNGELHANDLAAIKKLDVAQTADIRGKLTAHAEVQINGPVTFATPVASFTANSLTVNGPTSMNGSLTVSQGFASSFGGVATFQGIATFNQAAHFNDPIQARDRLQLSGAMVIVRQKASGAGNIDRLAVCPVNPQGHIGPAPANSDEVIGIGIELATGEILVAIAGIARARLGAGITAGSWLKVGNNGLEPAASADDSRRVAKALIGGTAGNDIDVLVLLA